MIGCGFGIAERPFSFARRSTALASLASALSLRELVVLAIFSCGACAKPLVATWMRPIRTSQRILAFEQVGVPCDKSPIATGARPELIYARLLLPSAPGNHTCQGEVLYEEVFL